jgi:adenosylcobyric acid synthase
VLEGAGSPVELNLMHRDIVNLRPVEHLDGRWLLVSDIERGGVFAQIVGTWNLLPHKLRERGLGVIVNQFRGDLKLFADAARWLAPHTALPYLGVVPHRAALQPESEDSLCRAAEQHAGSNGEELIAWIRFPHLSNSQDVQPWLLDKGVSARWTKNPADLTRARAIVLPGSKNTLADLAWMRETGLDRAILNAAQRGAPVLGICGGYQMLGRSLADADGVAGERGEAQGLNLLPVDTRFFAKKTVHQVQASRGEERWTAYEIHMGQTIPFCEVPPLLARVGADGALSNEGCRRGNVWGTYLHGLFESALMRAEFARAAGLRGHEVSPASWKAHQQSIYGRMADLIEEHLDLESVWRYVGA